MGFSTIEGGVKSPIYSIHKKLILNKADFLLSELAAATIATPPSVHTDRAVETNPNCVTQDHTFTFRRCNLGVRRYTRAII